MAIKFEISEIFKTNEDSDFILQILKDKFDKISLNVQVENDKIIAKHIEGTFGSINRSDTTTVSLKKKDSGYLCIADVDYKPSVWFWLLLLLATTTVAGVFVSVGIYLYHKKIVSEAVEKTLKRVKDEVEANSFNQTERFISMPHKDNKEPNKVIESDCTEKLEKLFELKEKGILTEEEFKVQKQKII